MDGVHGVGEGVTGGGLEGVTADELDGLLDRALEGEPQHADGLLPATQALASLAAVSLDDDEELEALDAPEALHDWYIAPQGSPVGPLPVAEVRARFERGELTPDTPCWSAGLSRWVPVSQVLQLTAPAAVPASETPLSAALAVVDSSFAKPLPRPSFQPVANAVLRALVAEEERARTRPFLAAAPEPQPVLEPLPAQPVATLKPSVEAPFPPAPAQPAFVAAAQPAAFEPRRMPTSYAVREGFALDDERARAPVQPSRDGAWRALALGMVLGGVVTALVVVLLLRTLVPSIALVPQAPVAAAPAAPAPTAAPAPQPAAAAPAAAKPEVVKAEPVKAKAVAAATKAARSSEDSEGSKRKSVKRAVETKPAEVAKAEGSGEVRFSEDEAEETAPAAKPPPPTPEQARLDAALDAEAAPKASAPDVYVPPAPGSADLPETLTHADVLEVVLANKSDLDGCIAAAKRDNPELEGPLVMRWSVSPEGAASDIQAETNDHVGTPLEKCVAEQIRTWKFPRTRTQGDPVRMPFKL